jgi:hypothetical protein
LDGQQGRRGLKALPGQFVASLQCNVAQMSAKGCAGSIALMKKGAMVPFLAGAGKLF